MTARRDGTDPKLTVPSAQAIADTAPAAYSRGIDSVMQSASVIASANTVAPSGVDRPIPAGPEVLPVVAPEVYVQLDEFARGGLGRIVRARDTRSGRIVAIKEMLVSSADAAARFVREALVTANLEHPAIVPVYEVGRWATTGQPFYAMKLVSGRPLDQVIAACKDDMNARLALVEHVVTVADALAYAHVEQRVIHRDLKPQNVLCGAHGETVVIDWGLARRLDEADAGATMPRISSAPPGATYVGAVMGTPSYMPPEQARGERADERADVYAIGALLYHTLAGRPPYVGRTLQELLDSVKANPPPPLREVEPRVPPDLAAIVEHAMARDLDKRYPSALELVNDLRRFTSGQLVLAHHYTKAQRVGRFVKRNRGILAIATVGLVTLAVVGALSIRNIMAAQHEAEEQGKRAVEKGNEARDRLVTAYLDRSRAELASGQTEVALAFAQATTEARGAEIDPEVRFIIGRALDNLPASRRYRDPKLSSAAFVRGSDDLVVASTTGVVRWSPDGDTKRWTSPGDTGDVFAYDTGTIFAGRLDGVALLDAETGKQLAHMRPSNPGHQTIGMFGTDRDRRWIAAPTKDTVELFEITTRARVASIPFVGIDRAPLVSPDGMRLLVGTPMKESFKSQLMIIDRTGKQIGTACTNCYVYAFAKDGEFVTASIPEAGKAARVAFADWNGKVRLELTPNTNSNVGHIDVDRANNRFVMGMHDGAVEVRDLATGKLEWHVGIDDHAYQVMFDKAGRVWVLGSYKGVLVFERGVEVGRWRVPGVWLDVEQERSRVAVIHPKNGLATWPIGDPTTRAIASSSARVRRLVFVDGGTIVIGSDDGAITRFDSTGPHEIGRHRARLTELVRLPDGGFLTSSRDNTTAIRDANGKVRVEISDAPRAAVAPDGHIAIGNDTGRVALWDPAGKLVRVLGQLGKPLMSVRWSADGQRIAAIDENAEVKVWARDGTLVRALPPSRHGVDLAFSPDGAWLFQGAIGPKKLYSLTGGKDRELVMHNNSSDQAYSATFSRDGRRLLVGGSGYVTIWSTVDGTIETTIPVGTNVIAAQFLIGERLIVAGGVDRKVRVWHTSGSQIAVLDAPDEVYGLVVDASQQRVAVLTLAAAMVWKLSSFTGDAQQLATIVKCRGETTISTQGVPQYRELDFAECNKLHAAPRK